MLSWISTCVECSDPVISRMTGMSLMAWLAVMRMMMIMMMMMFTSR